MIDLETENNFLRARLGIPEGPVANLGTGPTGRGKALKEGGVPMSERVRARKEAREKERLRLLAMGIVMEPPPTRGGKGKKTDAATPSESGNDSDRAREASTVSPARASTSLANLSGLYDAPFPAFTAGASSSSNNQFGLPFTPFNWNDTPTATPATTHAHTPTQGSNPDAIAQLQHFLTSGNDLSWAFPNGLASFGAPENPAPPTPTSAPTSDWTGILANWKPPTPAAAAAPPIPRPAPTAQIDLLHRLKMCCRFSDNHVERDPGLLVFAIHLCSNIACTFGGQHDGKRPRDTPDDDPAISLELAWPALQHQLDPNAAIDGEKRLNTAKMAAELLLRANALRQQAKPDAQPAVGCRRREGMSVSADLVRRLVEGLGGKAEDVRTE